tara:strand:+ start:974 stop:1690 length:717 start_codon:yes stop_codon:yes gene_type:complete
MKTIAMWSGPRNISTALMRSFENRPDTVVTDEPFYAHYLYKTKINHPMKNEIIENGNINWENITNELIGPIPKNKTVWYQKHMSQHNLPGYNLEWINKITNCILIRNPKDVIASFSKKFKLISSNQLGYKQQTVIYNLTKHNNKVIIVDADDILKNTEYIIKKLCYKLKIPFYKQMLSWPKGKRQSDGIWSRYWYKEVELSTGFNCYSNNKNTLFKDYYRIYLDCMDDYELLYDIRIK